MRAERNIVAPDAGDAVGDGRFRALLSDADWLSLPPAVRKRFSKHIGPGASAVYVGTITASRLSPAGWLLAQMLRVIGAPLPLFSGGGSATTVTVTEDGASGGQNWTRLYARGSGFPQTIHSTKRFSGPTGIEEHIGFGISMALALSVSEGGLVFTSAGYYASIAGRRVRLPAWIEPGRTVVTHHETTDGAFLFTLVLAHPLFGTLVSQEALYRDVEPCSDASY